MDKALVNPIEDQRKEALRHYDEAARLANYWSSFVRDAILAYNPTTMDKQDKTAIDFLKENVEMLWSHQEIGTYSPLVISAMESYAQHRTAELEAKIKALEERLEAADEVIAYTEKINFYATHGDVKREYDEAIAKYQSLKQ